MLDEDDERLLDRELPGRGGIPTRGCTRGRGDGDHDALTGLHNYRYFHERLAAEMSRAFRFNRPLS